MTENTTFSIDAMKAKIAKLLAKAEATTVEAERDTFNAKAQTLMVRLGIDAAELEAAGTVRPEEIVEMHRVFKGNYAIAMIPFAHGLARAYGNLTTLQSTSSYKLDRTLFIIGFKSDVEMFLVMLDSLVDQAHKALREWQKGNREERRYYTDQEKYLGNRSFLSGFGSRTAQRLRALRQATVEEQASTGAALVLASKKDQVDVWAQEKYNPKASKGGMRNHSADGMWAGRAAGERARLGVEPSLPGGRKEVR